jgi:hypothetical protein
LKEGDETMLASILAAALLMGTQTPELQVDVGHVNSQALPPLKAVPRAMPTSDMVNRVAGMIGTEGCSIRGQSRMHFDFDVPYAVQVNPDGSASHVVVGEMGCPALESYVGLLVLELARRGDFRASSTRQPRWYASSLNFNLQ